MITDKPTLVIISGPAGGAGKTTIAHKLAPLLGCPAICRDEIKEGMVYGTQGYVPRDGDAITMRTFDTFFAVLNVLLHAGVTIVAEASFQDHVWRPRLEPLAELAKLTVVQCVVDQATARRRARHRDTHDPRRVAHLRTALRPEGTPHPFDNFVRLDLSVPSIFVDTTDGYDPPLSEIVSFIEQQ